MTTFDDLFGIPAPRVPFHKTVTWGWEDDLGIATGFAQTAQLTARHWVEHRDDLLAFPILYLYRHSIELSLKWCIRLTARMALREGYSGVEDLSPATLDEKLMIHSIGKLVERLNRYLTFVPSAGKGDRLDAGILRELDRLDREDENGDTFRYTVIGVKNQAPARPAVESFDFHARIDALNKLTGLLFAYADHLAHHAEMLDDQCGG